MKVIPAIDIYDGKCVRLLNGDYNKIKIYNKNPLDVALQFEDMGVTNLHVVDLNGARSKMIINKKSIREICMNTSLKVDFGGGIKNDYEILNAFDLGVNQISLGTISVTNKDLVMNSVSKFGYDKIIIGVDFLKNRIKINGWTEETDLDLFEFINDYYKLGLKYFIITDISKDGALNGTSLDNYKKILNKFKGIKLIASGGVSAENDIKELYDINCYGVIAGKAVYENKINLKNAIKKYGS